MYDIHNFANNFLFDLIAILSSFCCLSYIVSFLRKKEIPFMSDTIFDDFKYSFSSKKIITVIIHMFLIFTLLFSSNYFVIKSFDCDDLRLMPDGTYCYYVKATNEKGKTYTLPANIQKMEGYYSVYNVYFDNGGYLYFGDTCIDIEYEDTADCVDQDEREWEIELTNWKTSHPMVDETKPYPTKDDYFRFVMVGLQSVTTILHLYFLFHRAEK